MSGDATLAQVASAAGVSMATASRALNGRSGVRPAVRDRVHAAAEELRYRPNRAAQNLAGGRSSVIGFVLGDHRLSENVYAARLVESLASAVEAHDQGLMLILTPKPGNAVRNIIANGLIDGLIISTMAVGEEWVEKLLDTPVPSVVVGAHPLRKGVYSVDIESVESSAAVVEHMLARGRTRMAHLAGPMYKPDAVRRLEGFRLAHVRRGIEVDEQLIFPGNFERDSGYALAGQVIESGADSVFGGNDDMVAGLLDGLRERAVRVPEDICVAGFDGTSHLMDGTPQVTSVAQPFELLAEAAVQTLDELVAGRTPADTVRLIEPEVLIGTTTRP